MDKKEKHMKYFEKLSEKAFEELELFFNNWKEKWKNEQLDIKGLYSFSTFDPVYSEGMSTSWSYAEGMDKEELETHLRPITESIENESM